MSDMSSSPGDASSNHSPGQHSPGVTHPEAASAPSSDVVVVSGPGSEGEETSGGAIEGATSDAASETVAEPGKVMRIGSMIKQLLEEVRQAPLDERSNQSRVGSRTDREDSSGATHRHLRECLEPDGHRHHTGSARRRAQGR